MKPVTVGALVGTVASVLVVSVPVTHAFLEPGVDIPYDPANYYSPVSISYADSAPSPFALRELSSGGSGGTPVYDFLREVQQILLDEKTKIILEQLGVKIDLLNLQIKKVPLPHTIYMDEKISKAQKKSTELNKIAEMEDSRVFGTPPTQREREKYDDEKQKELNSLSLEEKLAILTEQYQQIADTVKKNQEDVENLQESLRKISEENLEAEGDEQAWEINTKAKALQTEIITRENIIASQLVQLRAIEHRWKMAREAAEQDMIYHFLDNAKVADPFDEKAKEFWKKQGFERHEVGDWPEFE